MHWYPLGPYQGHSMTQWVLIPDPRFYHQILWKSFLEGFLVFFVLGKSFPITIDKKASAREKSESSSDGLTSVKPLPFLTGKSSWPLQWLKMFVLTLLCPVNKQLPVFRDLDRSKSQFSVVNTDLTPCWPWSWHNFYETGHPSDSTGSRGYFGHWERINFPPASTETLEKSWGTSVPT